MTTIQDFHHYKGSTLTRFEKVERRVIEIIALSNIADDKREDSLVFEFMHAAGCMQIARILSQKRALNINLSSIAAMLHDIHVIKHGQYKDHAKLGAPIAKNILEEVGGFSNEEIHTVTQAVAHHSEKEVYSDNPYVELVKDVDVFDCSLYKNAEGFYRLHKPESIFKEYVNRIKKMRGELGLSVDNVFR